MKKFKKIQHLCGKTVCESGLMWIPDQEKRPLHVEMLADQKQAEVLIRHKKYFLPLKNILGFKEDRIATVIDKKDVSHGEMFVILFRVSK